MGGEEEGGPSQCGVGGGVGGEAPCLVKGEVRGPRLFCNSSSSSSRCLNISLLN